MRTVVGLGSVPAAGWRPTRGWENVNLTVGRYSPASPASLKSVVEKAQQATARRLFTPNFFVSTCGQPNGLPCSEPAPQASVSGLAGLGLINVSLCSPFEAAIEALGEALKRARERNLSSPTILQAQKRYDDETSLLLWRRSQVFFGNCESKTKDIHQLIVAVNAELARAGSSPVLVPESVVEETKPPQESNTASTVKTVAIAASVVAGVVLLAPLVWEGVAWAKVARRSKVR